jgi:protein dithiol oxidoreductase (disulfide-forming)
MNCETIDSILDDHRAARLASPERRDVDAHLRTCDRCAEAWAAQHLLAGERFAAPPPGLFERLAGGLAAVEAAPARATATRARRATWLSPTLAAGVLVAMAVTIWRLPDTRLIVEVASAPPVSTPAPSVTAPVDSPPRAAATLVAGADYDLVGRGSLPAMSGGRAQVVEFFQFGCFPCYSFESQLERWQQIVEPRIEVVRIPVIWNERGELHARAYYTAAALDKLDIVRGPLFAEIHERGNPLLSAAALAKLFAAYGVDLATFEETFNSSAVDAQVERAAALAREYDITATPALVVGGRYLVKNGAANGMFAIAEELAGQSLLEVRERVQDLPTLDRDDRVRVQETLRQLRESTREPPVRPQGDPNF